MREIAEKWLDWRTLGPTVARYQALIAADVARDTRKLYPTGQFRGGVSGSDGGLQSFVEQRRAYLLKQR